ncbi:hypothetical protein RPB_2111 [Rhodopseudomonas palustris HaA2]|uniref:Uncharacterized protein n=1 Tax=Rhodopseudomonas palustris (strain HaA2) TaxID=316058 RepID=Q2IY93_RHOP2|nr:hypothetical protein RPB_2111 [Rhodopseudomonas palustris HaA2]
MPRSGKTRDPAGAPPASPIDLAFGRFVAAVALAVLLVGGGRPRRMPAGVRRRRGGDLLPHRQTAIRHAPLRTVRAASLLSRIRSDMIVETQFARANA